MDIKDKDITKNVESYKPGDVIRVDKALYLITDEDDQMVRLRDGYLCEVHGVIEKVKGAFIVE